jgi:hypothetical protein
VAVGVSMKFAWNLCLAWRDSGVARVRVAATGHPVQRATALTLSDVSSTFLGSVVSD